MANGTDVDVHIIEPLHIKPECVSRAGQAGKHKKGHTEKTRYSHNLTKVPKSLRPMAWLFSGWN